jgi:allantoinase
MARAIKAFCIFFTQTALLRAFVINSGELQSTGVNPNAAREASISSSNRKRKSMPDPNCKTTTLRDSLEPILAASGEQIDLALQAFLSSRIVTPQGIRSGALLIEDDRIKDVIGRDEVPAHAHKEDLENLVILPGLVDSHIHINEPGRTDWGGFETVTTAAAAGGYTTLVDMPLNCIPATTNLPALEAKRKAARNKCRVDWAAWGGVVPGNASDIGPLAEAGVHGFKCFLVHSGVEEFPMVMESDLRLALPRLANTGLPLLVHAELPGPIELATKQLNQHDWRKYSTYLRSRPDEAELAAIRVMIALSRQHGFHLHIVHLATAAALEMLRAAREEGLPVTVETCPHYLHLEAEAITDGATQCKCAPPIRDHKNREQLWQGLQDGIIDMVVTDHSPCPPAMKKLDEGDFKIAWGGIASLSMALPVIWTEAQQRGLSLLDVVRWMAEKPAHLAGCNARKGALASGYDADFVVFDADADFVVTDDRLHQGHAISPYSGERLRGVVSKTYLRGRQIFSDGAFPGLPAGRELTTLVVSTSA